MGAQTFPHSSINNLARCKAAYAAAGVGWALEGIWAPGVARPPGKPAELRRTFMLLTPAKRRVLLYTLGLPSPMAIGAYLGPLFSKSKLERACLPENSNLIAIGGVLRYKNALTVAGGLPLAGRACTETQRSKNAGTQDAGKRRMSEVQALKHTLKMHLYGRKWVKFDP